MNTQQQLNRAASAQRLLEQPEIQEAFTTLEDDMKEQLFLLQAGDEEVLNVHRAIKSLSYVKQRLESYAQSIQTHRNTLETEQRRLN